MGMGTKEEREALRVKVSPLRPIKVEFELVGDPLGYYSASANDISVGGVGILWTPPRGLGRGPRLVKGTIDLPDIGPVPFEGQIQWHSHPRVGIAFRRMPIRIQDTIFRFVCRRERETLSCRKGFERSQPNIIG